ncbi:hypothetical protein DMC25_20800 [Caulobacter sp. D4A]|uniref:endonuclease NucS domain-containing protein n=1 Tax=unclassified Caulobacter TaxID=2648921 RepID=UPI000D732E65|nr:MULTISPECIES: endonuclease NucS domain-containing protein [unclassified Caulobacter]PXA81213.1 hypothetical protein DMC25_20800 [Caulobacter sp. D4A]PXA88092.1 hypothetical protein DMC18_19765 [Caulobacter sp. D5]
MYRVAEFRDYFLNKVGAKRSSYNTYNSYLSRIDLAIGGLDETIGRDGIDAVINWGQTANVGPFLTYPSHARSVLKRYIQFVVEIRSPLDEMDEEDLVAGEPLIDEEMAEGAVFKVEREMQAAVRKQLGALESGLIEADGGVEVRVATGRIDILAKDREDKLVVIELKAGSCPPGALEQTLGYAEALAEERGEAVRAYLIAAEFSDRIRAAAKRVTGLQLRTYEFSLRFEALR